VITDDEVMRLFEEADPARAIDTAPVDDAATYFDALQPPTDVHVVKIGPASTPRTTRRGRTAVAAVAAVTALVVGVVAVAARDDEVPPEVRATTLATDALVPDPDINAFQDQLASICRAARERLESEVTEAGIGPQAPAYGEAMARVLEETLLELGALVPPDRVRDWWERAYGNLARLVDAWRNPDGPVAEIIHEIERSYGLVEECTLGSGR